MKRNSIPYKQFKVHLEQQDIKEYCISGEGFCAVELNLHGIVGTGFSKTHWRDEHDPILGLKIARGRAMKELVFKYWEEYIPF